MLVGRQCFKDAPLHDWTSDFADALRYLAKGRIPFVEAGAGVQQAIGADDPIFG